MARYAIYENDTGRMVADTEREPLDLRPGLSYTPVPDSDDGLMWDAATRTMTGRPPKVLDNTQRDRFFRLQQDPRFTALNTQQRTRVLELVTAFFADARYD